jgi:hypothetical protein
MNWAEAEMATADLGDERLNRRLAKVLKRLGDAPAASIPLACRGWAEVQGAYRLLDHENVTWEAVLEPHWACTQERMRAYPLVLCLQDTTELDFTTQPSIEGLGPLSYAAQHGLYAHPTLAVTPGGCRWGCWMPGCGHARSHGQDKRHWPIEAKESVRWLEGYERVAERAAELPATRLVYVADRECDIHAFLAKVQHLGQPADWLLRATHNRRTDTAAKLWDRVATAPVLGEVSFTLPAAPGRPARTVRQTLRMERVTLQPARGTAVEVTALLAYENNPPPGQTPLGGRLLTNRGVQTLEEALELIGWYRARWTIEVFFRIWKQGCRVETLQLRTLERLEPALALYLIIAWRVQFLLLMGRTAPELPCDVVFDPAEWQAAYLVGKRQPPPAEPPPLREMIALVASFGGWLGRPPDGPPGPKALWIGLQRIRDFALTVQVMSEMHPLSSTQ